MDLLSCYKKTHFSDESNCQSINIAALEKIAFVVSRANDVDVVRNFHFKVD